MFEEIKVARWRCPWQHVMCHLVEILSSDLYDVCIRPFFWTRVSTVNMIQTKFIHSSEEGSGIYHVKSMSTPFEFPSVLNIMWRPPLHKSQSYFANKERIYLMGRVGGGGE